MHAPLLSLQNISVQCEEKFLLKQVSLEIHTHEIVTVIGPNGAGKSTLVRVLLGLRPHYTGQIFRRPSLRVGYLPQKITLSAMLPLTARRFLQLHPTHNAEQLRRASERAQVPHALLSRPMQALSGGELQRVLLARALMNQPQLLVLDEPTRGLDVQGQLGMYDLIQTLRDTLTCSILLVSHDLHFVMAKTDRVICLNQHICCEGHPASVREHPEFIKLFSPDSLALVAPYQHHHSS